MQEQTTDYKDTLTTEIIARLGDNFKTGDNNVVKGLLEDYLSIANDFSNVSKKDTRLQVYVKEAVIEHYLRLGDEGTSSSKEGSLSSSYIDIVEKIKKDMLSIRVIK